MKQIKTRKNRNEIYIKKKSFLRCSYTIGFVFRVQCNRFVLIITSLAGYIRGLH